MKLKSYRGRYLVEPYYDPQESVEQFPSLIVPLEAHGNPEAQQGMVLSVGSGCYYPIDSYICFRPYRNHDVRFDGIDYLSVTEYSCVARVLDGDLVPKWNCVIVEPYFPETYEKTESGLLWLPQRLDDFGNPRTLGIVTVVGEDVHSVQVGDRVHFPVDMGVEIGFRASVVYILEEQHILSVVN